MTYRISAKGKKGHGIHSPFVYQWYTTLFTNYLKGIEKDLNIVKDLREIIQQDNTLLEINDPGVRGGHYFISVKEILKRSVSDEKKCQMLYLIARSINPTYIVELGTSLGLSTISLALAAPGATLHTIDGVSSIGQYAQKIFKQANVNNIFQHIGLFEEILPNIIKNISFPFLVFIDGNHRYEATVNYFHRFGEILRENCCIIVDDIHWSEEMERAWIKICTHARSTICLDFFYFVVVFFKENTQKTLYKLRY